MFYIFWKCNYIIMYNFISWIASLKMNTLDIIALWLCKCVLWAFDWVLELISTGIESFCNVWTVIFFATVFELLGMLHNWFTAFVIQVPDAGIPLSQLFSAMEQAKSRLKVEDYTVHQTTLEQIFLTFTRAQFPPREIKDRSILHTVCPCLT